MKRILSLSLVLLLLVCSFASCDMLDIDKIINIGGGDAVDEDQENDAKGTEDSTERDVADSKEKDTEYKWWDNAFDNGLDNKDENEQTDNIEDYGMERVSDTVYVLHDANIRSAPSSKITAKIIATAPFATALTRSAKNSEWSLVTYVSGDGSTVHGYISNELITVNKQTVTFVEQKTPYGGDVITRVKGDESRALCYFPLTNGYPHTVTLDIGSAGEIKGGATVIVLQLSQDYMWAKIKCSEVYVELNDGSYTVLEIDGYIPYEFLEISDDDGGFLQPDNSVIG